jgi:hypothetical protein
MYYVEFLRVMRTLRLVGYILGAFILLSLVLRPFSHDSFIDANTVAGVDPSTVPAHQNADGSTTRSFTGKQGQHVTIVIRKDRTETITVDEAAKAGSKARGTERVQVGPVSVISTHTGRRHISTITRDVKIPFFILIQIAACAAAIVATLFGLALSRENDGHLELAWTKPASRETYALTTVAMDALGVLGTGLATLLTIVLVLAIYGGAGYIVLDEHVLPTLIFGICFALSFYGIVLAATASMRRGGLVLSLLWPAALILPGLVTVRWMNLGTIARVLNTINPVAYFYAFSSSPESTRLFTLLPNGTVLQILALAVLFVLGVAFSLAQWRRLEA